MQWSLLKYFIIFCLASLANTLRHFVAERLNILMIEDYNQSNLKKKAAHKLNRFNNLY